MTRIGRVLLTICLGIVFTVGTVAPASAEVVTIRETCVGAQVIRCAWLNFDTVNQRVRGHVRITDTAGGGNYDVDVNEIRMQRQSGSAWETLSPVVPHYGFKDTTDTGATALYRCNPNGIPNVYRVRARFVWHVAPESPSEWQWLHTSAFGC